jgi:hypothetical protein
MNKETNITPEKKAHEPNYPLRQLGALAAVLAIAVSGGNIASAIAHRDDRPVKFPEFNGIGFLDKSILSLTLAKGAKIRSEPFLPSDLDTEDTLLDVLDEPLEVSLNDGAIVDSMNRDGTFYGIPAESLSRYDPNLKIQGDSDGTVWVSDQRATPERTKVVDESKQ